MNRIKQPSMNRTEIEESKAIYFALTGKDPDDLFPLSNELKVRGKSKSSGKFFSIGKLRQLFKRIAYKHE
jgi:hypothetical protein